MENSQRAWILCIIVLSLNFLTTKRHLILEASKLNQHKALFVLKFDSKDMLLSKRVSGFVSTKDEN